MTKKFVGRSIVQFVKAQLTTPKVVGILHNFRQNTEM